MKPRTFSKDDRINDGNETPKYLAGLKKELERSSYTLRKNFKATNNLRAKIILSNLKQKLKEKVSTSGKELFRMEGPRSKHLILHQIFPSIFSYFHFFSGAGR